jgi:hypothetical protein
VWLKREIYGYLLSGIDVGRISDDEIIGRLYLARPLEPITGRIHDPTVNIVSLRVGLSHRERFTADIHTYCSDIAPLLQQFNNQRNRETSRTDTEIHKAKGSRTSNERESLLNNKLRFRTRHKNRWTDREREPPKLSLPGDVRYRLASLPSLNQSAEVGNDLRGTHREAVHDKLRARISEEIP